MPQGPSTRVLLLAAALVSTLPAGNPARAQSAPQPGQPPAPATSPPVMQIPGLVIAAPTAPPAPVATPLPQAAPPPTPPPAAAPKPKRKVAVAKPSGPATAGAPNGGSGRSVRIVLKVNDDPITDYDIEQRARLMSLSDSINKDAIDILKRLVANPAVSERFRETMKRLIVERKIQTKEQFEALRQEQQQRLIEELKRQAVEQARAASWVKQRDAAREDLILERLKLQEAKAQKIVIEDKDVSAMLRGIAERNKKTEAQLAEDFKHQGIDIATLRARYRANLAWSEVIKKLYGHDVIVGETDIDQIVTRTSTEELTELHLLKLTVPYPPKADQRSLLESYDLVSKAQAAFKGCGTAAAQLANLPGARVQDLGFMAAGKIAEPNRSLLLATADGGAAPFSASAEGSWETYAVCERKVSKASDEQRTEAANRLRQQQFEGLSERHLRDLRQQANLTPTTN